MEQFNLPPGTLELPIIEIRSIAEVDEAMTNLKQGILAELNKFAQDVFGYSGPVWAKVWELDIILSDWFHSLIIPFFKKD